MATGASMYTFVISLSDVDRGVYEEISLRIARHPSETSAYLMTRVLAYCLEHAEGIALTEGVSATDEPAVLVRDLTGAITAWIEVGAPDAERVHRGSRLADRTAVYTHRDPARVAAAWAGKKLHRAEDVALISFEPGFVERAAERIERRNTMSVSVTERELYLELNGDTTSTPIHEVRAG